MAKRPRIGDIIELDTPGGLGYLQFCSRDPDLGYCLRVLRGIFRVRPAELDTLALEPEVYYVFFPLGAAISRGIVRIVGHATVPHGRERPSRMRRAVGVSAGGKELSWAIVEGRHVRCVGTLSEDERDLSIHEIWNDTLLAERLADGWTPRKDWDENQRRT